MSDTPGDPQAGTVTLAGSANASVVERRDKTGFDAKPRITIPEHRALLRFGLRFVVAFAIMIIPWPYLANSYVVVFDHAANVVLWATDSGARIGYRFETPDEIRADGSWDAILRVEDRQLMQTARMKIGVRTFSYRPVATFVALLVAVRQSGWRKNTLVAVVGMLMVLLVSFAIAALATLRFGLARVLGLHHERLIETAYQSLTTPAMLYALPVLVFVLLLAIVNRRRIPSAAA
jgi:hypothetical protein